MAYWVIIGWNVLQGVVYWQPPEQALDKVKELVWEPSISRYGPDEGIPALREALVQKVYYLECLVLQIMSYVLVLAFASNETKHCKIWQTEII